MKKFTKAVLAIWRFVSFLLLLSGLIVFALMVVLTLWDKNFIPYQNYTSLVLAFCFIFMLIGSTGIEKTFKIMNNMIKAKKGT